jgi:hypothetical protein
VKDADWVKWDYDKKEKNVGDEPIQDIMKYLNETPCIDSLNKQKRSFFKNGNRGFQDGG